MKIITLHSDFIEVEGVKKAIKDAEKNKKLVMKDCLVVFSAVEKGDDEKVAKPLADEIANVAKQVKTKKIMLYPWVHLTTTPSTPTTALKVLKKTHELLSKNFEVERSPFGWYKTFNIKVKGHPLSELSREIKAGKEEEVSEALKAEDTLKSYWYVLEPSGKLHNVNADKGKITGYNFSKNKNLESFFKYEIAKDRTFKKEPMHIKYMRDLELVDYEPASDPGNLRFYPKGRLIKSLIERYVSDEMVKNGAMEIESPIMYDFEHPSLKSYLHRFPARQYTIQTPNKKVFLRFAACFGQFIMAHDANISYKNMPMWMYELTRYSFRVEKRGELSALRRQRAFTMPDCHAFATDLKQAKEEMMKRFDICWQMQENFGFKMPEDLEFAIRMTKDFWNKNKDFVIKMVKQWGRPTMIEMWDKRFFYYSMKYEFNFVDAYSKASSLSTDQFDVENAERYGIEFVDKDGKKKNPIILHCSPSGGIERLLYTILEKQYVESLKGKKPILPLWLSPTQVRLVPISDTHLKYCEQLAKKFKNIRVDVDDRNITMQKKVRDAEKEWINATCIIGEKEVKGNNLSVRFRSGDQKTMTLNQLTDWVKKQTEGMPYRQLPLPQLLSKRPVFVG